MNHTTKTNATGLAPGGVLANCFNSTAICLTANFTRLVLAVQLPAGVDRIAVLLAVAGGVV